MDKCQSDPVFIEENGTTRWLQGVLRSCAGGDAANGDKYIYIKMLYFLNRFVLPASSATGMMAEGLNKKFLRVEWISYPFLPAGAVGK